MPLPRAAMTGPLGDRHGRVGPDPSLRRPVCLRGIETCLLRIPSCCGKDALQGRVNVFAVNLHVNSAGPLPRGLLSIYNARNAQTSGGERQSLARTSDHALELQQPARMRNSFGPSLAKRGDSNAPGPVRTSPPWGSRRSWTEAIDRPQESGVAALVALVGSFWRRSARSARAGSNGPLSPPMPSYTY